MSESVCVCEIGGNVLRPLFADEAPGMSGEHTRGKKQNKSALVKQHKELTSSG